MVRRALVLLLLLVAAAAPAAAQKRVALVIGNGAYKAQRSLDKPDAGNPPVRFDERGEETERWSADPSPAPLPDSTVISRAVDSGRDNNS